MNLDPQTQSKKTTAELIKRLISTYLCQCWFCVCVEKFYLNVISKEKLVTQREIMCSICDSSLWSNISRLRRPLENFSQVHSVFLWHSKSHSSCFCTQTYEHNQHTEQSPSYFSCTTLPHTDSPKTWQDPSCHLISSQIWVMLFFLT